MDLLFSEVFHEGEAVGEGLGHALVLGFACRVEVCVVEEGEVPVFGVVEVCESAVEEGADEVEGHGGVLVSFDHEVRVWCSGFWIEWCAVDEISEVAWEGAGLAVVVCGFGWGGAWFGVLTCEASDSGNGGAESMDEDEGHLEEDFEFGGDVFGSALVECFGAVSALEDEALSELGLGDLGFEFVDLA